MVVLLCHHISNFYPRSPCGERLKSLAVFGIRSNFYPRSPCGERPIMFVNLRVVDDFYPRSPCGERRGAQPNWNTIRLFLSTLSLRRATLTVSNVN